MASLFTRPATILRFTAVVILFLFITFRIGPCCSSCVFAHIFGKNLTQCLPKNKVMGSSVQINPMLFFFLHAHRYLHTPNANTFSCSPNKAIFFLSFSLFCHKLFLWTERNNAHVISKTYSRSCPGTLEIFTI